MLAEQFTSAHMLDRLEQLISYALEVLFGVGQRALFVWYKLIVKVFELVM